MAKAKKNKLTEKVTKKKAKEKPKKKSYEEHKQQKREHYAANRKTILAQQQEHHRLLKLGLKKKGPPRKKRGLSVTAKQAIQREKWRIAKRERDAKKNEAKRKAIIENYNKLYGKGSNSW